MAGIEPIGIAIVAPGGYAPDQAALTSAISRLQAQNCVIHNYYDPDKKFQRFGGTDAARVAQLHAAATNSEVQVVLALRGGYGLSRLLPALDLSLLVDSGKLFVGHSDFTALQMALMAHAGTGSFAGPMLCNDFACAEPSTYAMTHFWQCLTGPTHTVTAEVTGNPNIDVTGTLWGGNLAMLTHLLGTPYFPKIDGGILFVEDVNEHPYRVERMLLQLLHAGVLAKQQALVLGDFSSYRLSEYDNGYDATAMLEYLRAQLPVPVLTGLPFGHMRDKVTLAIGSRAELTATDRMLTLTMTEYPYLRQAVSSQK